MLDEIVGVASSGGLGAIVGLIGGSISRYQQYKMRKIEIQAEVSMRKMDIEESKLERQHDLDMADKQIEIAETEADIAYDQQDLTNLGESIKLATQNTGIFFVDAIRGLMRPLITIFLMGLLTWLLYQIWGEIGGLDALSPDRLIAIFEHMVHQITFLGVTAVAWWFASRGAKLEIK